MKTDLLSQYASIRQELQREKAQLEQKLHAINEALGETSGTTSSVTRISSASTASRGRGRKGGAPGGHSLKSMVLQVLGNGPLSKEEILNAVQRQGYTFNSKNPANSLGVILYGKKPKFNRVDGKFGLPGGKAQTAGTKGSSVVGGKPKRQMSPAARKRIADAAKKRWAAARAAGKKKL